MITEWQRQLRRRHLGSSDMPIIMGLSPYSKTPSDIYWSKVAETPDDTTEAMTTGNWLEGPLLDWAAGELGVRIDTDPADLFTVAHEGDGKDLLAANHDALIVGRREGIEAKFRNSEGASAFGDEYTDQVPYDILVQVQHQMYCGNLDKVYVSLGTPSYYKVDRKLYIVPRDEEIIEQIVKFGVNWWQRHVEAQIPPNGETVPPLYVLKAIERKAGAQIKLSNDAKSWADKRIALKAQIKALGKDVDKFSAKLIHALSGAEIGLLPDGRKVTYHQYESNRFNSKQFKIDHPDMAPEYTTKSSHRTLYIKKK